MKILAVPGLAICFLFWALYRLLVKRDLKNHMSDFYGGLVFIGIWAVLYVIFTHI